MKTNRILSIIGAAFALTTFLSGANSLCAQTFSGAKQLTETPKRFGALIYPVETRPQTIRVNFDNPDRKMVRMVIQHESGAVVYDEYKHTIASREYFDLSPLPSGNYVVDLSTGRERIRKTFTIESSRAGRIAMGDPTDTVTPEFPVRKLLIVSH